jgi:hypothetical protein
MCANCLTTFDVVVSQAIAVGVVLKRPVQDRLAVAGLVRPFDQLGEHANTVAFLRSLDLDPVEILGADVVAAAATWKRAPWSRRRFSVSALLPGFSRTALRA